MLWNWILNLFLNICLYFYMCTLGLRSKRLIFRDRTAFLFVPLKFQFFFKLRKHQNTSLKKLYQKFWKKTVRSTDIDAVYIIKWQSRGWCNDISFAFGHDSPRVIRCESGALTLLRQWYLRSYHADIASWSKLHLTSPIHIETKCCAWVCATYLEESQVSLYDSS